MSSVNVIDNPAGVTNTITPLPELTPATGQ